MENLNLEEATGDSVNQEAEAQSVREKIKNLNLEEEADNGVDLMNFEEGAYDWVNEAEAQSMREKLKIFEEEETIYAQLLELKVEERKNHPRIRPLESTLECQDLNEAHHWRNLTIHLLQQKMCKFINGLGIFNKEQLRHLNDKVNKLLA